MTEPRYVWRVLVVTVAVLGVWIGLGSRLAFLHLGPNAELRERIEQRRHTERTILGPRGRIMDCEGNIVALDLAVKDVVADPETVMKSGQMNAIGKYLAHMLELPPATVFSRLNRPERRYERLKRYVHEDVTRRLEQMQLQGIFFEDVTARNYPLGSMMAHVIGFSNVEGVGSAGIEQEMNTLLRGRPGLRVSQKDGRRRELYTRRELEIDPQSGADVYLTIDQKIQYFVEKALDAAMEEHSAAGCWAIVQRVRTGEILAMASRPNYDLNAYRHAKPEVLRNGALGYVYEPGSTFKGLVLAAALNEKLVSPQDTIFCENGSWFYQGRSLRDYHGYGNLSVADVLKKSSNIGMAKIALKLGPEKLSSYLEAFGIGKKTEIDLPGEETGIFHDTSKWSAISITRLAMGHEVATTAMQILNAYCCIANDGYLMQPHVVRRVVAANGHTILDAEANPVARPIREDTARLMCRLLGRVTEDGGTARRARVEGYSVAGKTGTAQKPIPGGYSDSENMASFVGFLPVEDPEIGIIVVVDTPQPKHTGGVVAAPVFREIAEQAVRYLDVPSGGGGATIQLGRAD